MKNIEGKIEKLAGNASPQKGRGGQKEGLLFQKSRKEVEDLGTPMKEWGVQTDQRKDRPFI